MYAVHPGRVPSKTDGQRHFISGWELARLYKLQAGQFIVWDDMREETFAGKEWKDYVHLFPDYHGRYSLPT